MQEFEIDDLAFETDLQEDEYDPESCIALEKFLQTLNIKNAKDVPAFKSLSHKSKNVLKRFCSCNNNKNRAHKIIEIFKCLDWIDFKDIDLSLLNKLSEDERKIILKDIHIYLNKKEEKLAQKRNWNKEYKKKIIEYYKKTIPAHLKLELESLRDHELNLVGHDRNWQYYFQFKSFKSIDNFLNLSHLDRNMLFDNFKKDVLSYKTNKERNLFGEYYDRVFSHKGCDDDTVKSINWESTGTRGKGFTRKDVSSSTTSDYDILGLPDGADVQSIKKQYRKLAQIYHPDKPDGNETKMKDIVGAYQRLVKR